MFQENAFQLFKAPVTKNVGDFIIKLVGSSKKIGKVKIHMTAKGGRSRQTMISKPSLSIPKRGK